MLKLLDGDPDTHTQERLAEWARWRELAQTLMRAYWAKRAAATEAMLHPLDWNADTSHSCWKAHTDLKAAIKNLDDAVTNFRKAKENANDLDLALLLMSLSDTGVKEKP